MIYFTYILFGYSTGQQYEMTTTDVRAVGSRLNSNPLWGFQNKPLFGSSSIAPSRDLTMRATNGSKWNNDLYAVSSNQNQTYDVIDTNRALYESIDTDNTPVCRFYVRLNAEL